MGLEMGFRSPPRQLQKEPRRRSAKGPCECRALSGEVRQQLQRCSGPDETDRRVTATKGRKEPLLHLRGTQLAGICCLQEARLQPRREDPLVPCGEHICTGRHRDTVLNTFA